MATKRDLLKEAIADAKAVKEMAIANAKAALEETFTPQLKSMLSAKLQEMEEEEEEMDEALGTINDPDTPTSHGNVAEMEEEEELDETIDLNELLDELNEEEEEEETEESEESETEEEGEPIDLEDMTDEDLKKMIEDVISDMVASGELEAGHEEAEEEMEMEPEAEEEEEINLDELLAEIASLDEEMEEEEEEEELDEIFGLFGKPGSGGTKFVKDFINANKMDIDKVKSIEDKTARLDAAKPLITKFFNENVRKMDGSALRSDISVLRNAMDLEGLGGGGKSSVSIAELESQLEEAHSAIETLRGELNEVNLLNAKLLYTNKIFKAKNLTESQKINVLGMFDKAKNVGEVKLVFETLSEGLKSKANTIKENLGSASKTMGTTNTKQPIVESNDMVARFKKLAGII